MPRIARSNDQTALSRQNSENVGNITSIKGKGLPEKQTRGGNNLKRPAEKQTVNNSECNAKTRRRAALGEITNAKSGTLTGYGEKESKTLKSQMKKGLSVIVNKTAAITNTNNGKSSAAGKTNSSTLRVVLRKDEINRGTILLATSSGKSSAEKEDPTKVKSNASKKCKRKKEDVETSTSSLEEDIEMLSFDSRTESSSLPSSQEAEDLQQQLKEKANKLYTTVGENDAESSISSNNFSTLSVLNESIEKRKSNVAPSSRYVPPPRITPPNTIQDFDLENWNDPSQCSEYAQDIFQYYKNREEQFRCPDYLHTMPTGARRGSIGHVQDITEGMRAILVDWLVEVQESFELNHETLYTAVKLMDLYLSKVFVTKEELQLVGATACLIACKIDERIPPNLDDFVYVCDDAYSRQEIMAKERDMIETVDYDVGYSLSYRFLRRYGRVCQVTMPVLTLARYILETSLMEYKFNVQLSESLLAAATLSLAMKVQNIDCSQWIAPLTFYSGHDIPKIRPVFHALHQMLFQEQKEATKTIRQKYSHRVFHEVALIKIPNILDL